MTKASESRIERKMAEKEPEAHSSQEGAQEPIRSDCGICRRSPNCVVFQGYQAALQQSLGSAERCIPGIKLQPSLSVDCPEFAMTPEVEAAVRERIRDQQKIAAVPQE